MYYQSLMNMKQDNRIRRREIKLLDEWLIRVPNRNRNSLNFLQFSIDEDINEEIAFHLFIAATQKGVEVLRIYYNVVTNDRMHSLGVFDSKSEIPKEIHDYNSGEAILVKDSNIEVRFQLSAFPVRTLSIINEPKKEKKVSIPTIESVKSYLNHHEMSSIFK